MNRLEGVRACVFDAYGTLFDFSSAAAACPDIAAEKRAALTALWRDKQLQYTWLRLLQGRYTNSKDFQPPSCPALCRASTR